jgi:chemotaxis protein MotB
MANEPQPECEECEEGSPGWVVTFADLMSLLMCFFILLLSFSQTDSAKFKELAGSLEKAFGVQRLLPAYEPPKGMTFIAKDFEQAFVKQPVVGEGDQDPLEHEMKEKLQASEADLQALLKTLETQDLAEIDKDRDHIVMRLMGHTAFASGQATIKPEMIPVLQTIGEVIGHTTRNILVAGHTDNVPLHGGPHGSNLGLSAARAAAVVDFFLTHGLIRPEKIATMAFGEYRPLVPNDTPEHRARNRRVEIILAARSRSH